MTKSNHKSGKKVKEVRTQSEDEGKAPKSDHLDIEAANKKLKWETGVVCLDQPDYGTPSTETHEETAGERNAQMTTKKKTKTRTKRDKQVALHRKRHSGTKKYEVMRLPSSIRRLNILDNFVDDGRVNYRPPVPPFDLSATTVEGAYPLAEIISVDEWVHLSDVLDLSNAGAEVDSNVYPRFVCNRVHRLDDNKDAKEKMKLAGIFSYIAHLIQFKDQTFSVYVPAKAKAKAKECKIPDILFQKFSSMFAPADRLHMQNVFYLQKLAFYTLVLTLHADNFRTNLNDISKDLRGCEGSQCTTQFYYRFLGCEVKEDEVSLSMPVKFPKPRTLHPDFLKIVRWSRRRWRI